MFIFADSGSGYKQKMGFFLYRRICGGELKGLFIAIDSASNMEETDTVVGLFRSEEAVRGLFGGGFGDWEMVVIWLLW